MVKTLISAHLIFFLYLHMGLFWFHYLYFLESIHFLVNRGGAQRKLIVSILILLRILKASYEYLIDIIGIFLLRNVLRAVLWFVLFAFSQLAAIRSPWAINRSKRMVHILHHSYISLCLIIFMAHGRFVWFRFHQFWPWKVLPLVWARRELA